MTVSASLPSYIQTPGNGSGATFAFPFKIFSVTDLLIGFITASGYALQAGGFTVQNVDVNGGGSITFTTPPPIGVTVDIRTVTPMIQNTEFANLGQFLPENHTEAFDRLTRIVQDLYRLTYTFGIHGPDQESVPWAALPGAGQRKNNALLFDNNGLPTIGTVVSQALTQSLIGQFLYPQTAAEMSAGIMPVNFYYPPEDVRRFGIVPNSPSAAPANTVYLKALLDPTKIGPVGRLFFVNSTGADIYYFNDMIQVRDGTHIDGCNSQVNFAKTYASADDTMGFFTFIRDVTIENLSITVNYNGTGGVDAGPVMRIGSRSGSKFGAYTAGIFDKTDLTDNGLPPMGNITLRNLRMSTNNPNAAVSVMVLMYGGLQNFLAENIVLTGNGANGPESGFYYEFGFATQNGYPSVSQQWSSSHAHGLVFRNIRGYNLNTTVNDDPYVIAMVEAYSVIAENIHSYNCGGTFEARIGEAHFFRPWTADSTGIKRTISIRNITSQGATASTIFLGGSQPSANGYLSDANMIAAGLPVLTNNQKVDLYHFSVDGFAADAAGNGIKVSGPCSIRNGYTIGCTNGLFIDGDAVYFEIQNVKVFNSTDVGIRASDPSSIFVRNKIGSIRNCKVCGSTGAAIGLNYTQSVSVDNNQLGYNTSWDPSNETTQTSGVNVAANGYGVVCKGNYVTTSGGALAYNISGSGDRGCNILTPSGTVTWTSGQWQINGVSQASQARIASKTDPINTYDKYLGKECYDTTNSRTMIAQGPNNTDNWVRADGGVTVTPS